MPKLKVNSRSELYFLHLMSVFVCVDVFIDDDDDDEDEGVE